jgi:hypothetical protein
MRNWGFFVLFVIGAELLSIASSARGRFGASNTFIRKFPERPPSTKVEDAQ